MPYPLLAEAFPDAEIHYPDSDGEYRPIRRAEPSGQAPYLVSDVLGLELHLRGQRLRFRDPISGRDLPDYAEIDDALQAAEERARKEARERVALEARLAELEARLPDHD